VFGESFQARPGFGNHWLVDWEGVLIFAIGKGVVCLHTETIPESREVTEVVQRTQLNPLNNTTWAIFFSR
jgi:hypothetical protein